MWLTIKVPFWECLAVALVGLLMAAVALIIVEWLLDIGCWLSDRIDNDFLANIAGFIPVFLFLLLIIAGAMYVEINN